MTPNICVPLDKGRLMDDQGNEIVIPDGCNVVCGPDSVIFVKNEFIDAQIVFCDQ